MYLAFALSFISCQGAAQTAEKFSLTQEISPTATLAIDQTIGSLSIIGWDEPKIDIQATKKGTPGDLDLIKIDTKISPDSILIKTKCDQSSYIGSVYNWCSSMLTTKEYAVDYTIKVPRNLKSIIIQSKKSDVAIKQVNCEIVIKMNQGETILSDIGNHVKIEKAHGDTILENITGSIELSGNKSDVDIQNAHGLLTISLNHADIRAHTVKGPVTIQLSKGDIELKNITDKISIHIHRGDIHIINSASTLDLKTSHGDILLEKTKNKGKIKTQDGNIVVKEPNQEDKGRLHLSAPHGKVKVNS